MKQIQATYKSLTGVVGENSNNNGIAWLQERTPAATRRIVVVGVLSNNHVKTNNEIQ